MEHPYVGLPERQFWKQAVAGRSFSDLQEFYTPKFSLPAGCKVGAAGSCFAQHIRKFFIKNGLDVYDVEPAPKVLLEKNEMGGVDLLDYGYGIYSARFGNIYTVRQLLQLAQETLLDHTREGAEIIWGKGGRFYDALRPGVFKYGFESARELLVQRNSHISKVKKLFINMDYFIFTLGLTEAWGNSETGLIYPTAPGVIAGEYREDLYSFVNFGFEDVYEDFVSFRELVKEFNPKLKFIITVSPVSLAATATDEHVLVATSYSKSVLRAVSGTLAKKFDDIDYFPSYDLLTSPVFRYSFHQPNLREIHPHGVDVVMDYFASAHPVFFENRKKQRKVDMTNSFCEETFIGERVQ